MTIRMLPALVMGVFLICCTVGVAQDEPVDPAGAPDNGVAAQENASTEPEDAGGVDDVVDNVTDAAKQAVDATTEKVDEIKQDVDADETAQEVAAGILQPIYALAERFETISAFYWIAFAVMAAGVVSFALQLVLGKLIALARMGFSMTEILSDGLGLVVSLVGLVLTTQAATENSNFTSSAFAVLSASIVGAVVGFIFYLWGQRVELEAIEGRKLANREAKRQEKKK